jgi:hypothetical protein
MYRDIGQFSSGVGAPAQTGQDGKAFFFEKKNQNIFVFLAPRKLEQMHVRR